MSSLNSIHLIGRLGADAEMRYDQSGKAQLKFNLAVDGYKKDDTTWFNCILFGDRAEKLAEFLTKGKSIYVEGRMASRSWVTQEGAKRNDWNVVVGNVQLLGGGERTERAETRTARTEEAGDDLPWD